MFSFLIYNIILLNSIACGYIAEFSNNRSHRILARWLFFFTLFVPAAIRYEVGYDYGNYSEIYNNLVDAYIDEPGFLLLQNSARYLDLETQWIFILTSFVMYFPISFCIGRKSFFLISSFYTLYVYIDSLSFVRQFLAVTFLICALYYYLYSDNKLKTYLYGISSLLFHFSALFAFLTYPFKKFKLGKPIYIYGLIFIFYILVVKFNFINVIFTVAMLLIPRYGGYMNTDWNSEVEIGSGLGVLIRLSIPFVIFFFRKKLLEQNPKNLYLILLNLVYVIVNILTIKVQIFGRLNTLFLFVALFNMAALYQLDSKYRKLVVFSLFLLSVFFFERNILNVYPYQTIFGQLLIH